MTKVATIYHLKIGEVYLGPGQNTRDTFTLEFCYNMDHAMPFKDKEVIEEVLASMPEELRPLFKAVRVETIVTEEDT